MFYYYEFHNGDCGPIFRSKSYKEVREVTLEYMRSEKMIDCDEDADDIGLSAYMLIVISKKRRTSGRLIGHYYFTKTNNINDFRYKRFKANYGIPPTEFNDDYTIKQKISLLYYKVMRFMYELSKNMN